jgi:hypothetical protein
VAIRFIGFLGGSVFGAVGAIIGFWFEHFAISWWIVALCALVMGLLAAAFGRKFWDTAVGIWP